MKAIALIPARYASTRLPGKPLLKETGKFLVQHVVEAVAQASSVEDVIVATDDQRIVEAVESFGGKAVMTSPDCRTGTDRLAEAARTLSLADEQIVVNVQGDEPDIPPTCVDRLAEMLDSSDLPMATLATPLPADQADNPNRVKVVCDQAGRAMYFSRSKIPYDRDATGPSRYLLHLGVYAYRAGFVATYAALPSTPAEASEKLEQLRALEHGYRIGVGVVDYDGVGIDTPEDYQQFVSRVGGRSHPERQGTP